MPTYLVPDDESHRPVMMDRAVLFFGRHPDCDVVITCSRKVSRKHCCIAQIDDYFVIRDLGSMNGVRVNGHPGGREHVLAAGDSLLVGDVPFTVQTGQFDVPKGKLVIGPKPGSGPPEPGTVQPKRRTPAAVPPVAAAAESDGDRAAGDSLAADPEDAAPPESMAIMLDEDDLVDDGSGDAIVVSEAIDDPESEVLMAAPISDDGIGVDGIGVDGASDDSVGESDEIMLLGDDSEDDLFLLDD